MFKRFLQNDDGATAIEYGLIAAIVSVGIIVVLKNVSGSLQSTFNTVDSELASASK